MYILSLRLSLVLLLLYFKQNILQIFCVSVYICICVCVGERVRQISRQTGRIIPYLLPHGTCFYLLFYLNRLLTVNSVQTLTYKYRNTYLNIDVNNLCLWLHGCLFMLMNVHVSYSTLLTTLIEINTFNSLLSAA